MPLNDFIRQETDHRNNMQLTMAKVEQSCDREISYAISECINNGAKKLYDEICKSIASILSSGAFSAEGDVPFPEYCYLDNTIQKRLEYLMPSGFSADDDRIFRDIISKKASATPFVDKYISKDERYVSALELWTAKTDRAGIRKTFLKGAYLQPFWDTLCQLAAADRVQLAYRIDVQDTVRDRKSRSGYSSQHNRYLQFGEYVRCTNKSIPSLADRLLGDRPHTIYPVILFKYFR